MKNNKVVNEIIQEVKNSDQNLINIYVFVEKYLISKGYDSEYLDLHLDKLAKNVLTYFKQDIANCQKKFLTPIFQLSEYNNKVISRSEYSVHSNKRDEIISKVKYRQKVFDALRDITWQDLEELVRYILKSNKLKDINITQSSKDQGIDFYGFLEFEDLTLKSNRLSNDINIRLVGQAKHSSVGNKVNHQKVSSFATEIRKLRKRQSSTYFTCIDDVFYKNDNPIVGLFITNTSYTPKSEDFAQEYGIIIWDGEQISDDLSTPDYVARMLDPNGKMDIKQLLD